MSQSINVYKCVCVCVFMCVDVGVDKALASRITSGTCRLE